MDQEKIGIAVALFEHNFSEVRVEEALAHCNTLESAIEWLSTPMATSSTVVEVAHMEHQDQNTSSATLALIDEAEKHSTPRRQHLDPLADNSSVAEEKLRKGMSIRPMAKDDASALWIRRALRWPCIRQALKDKNTKGAKRSVSPDGIAESTPTKQPRTEEELQTGSPHIEETASMPFESPESKRVIDEASVCGSPPLSDDVDPCVSPSGSPNLKASEQSTARSADALLSPKPSSRRTSSTPGTSPRAQLKYSIATETCGICFNDVKKGKAVRLGCRHGWYCGDCMVRHAEARVEVGAAYVACPECVAPIAECNLRRLVPPELIERLLARSLEQAVSATADLWACPTPNCPMRVSLEEGEEPRLKCTTCKKESCLRCGAQPYHTNMSCEEYAAANRSKSKASAKAEASFRKWMNKTGTKQCPTCGMAVSKQNLEKQQSQFQECHKMMCRNCNTKFCFKCQSKLTDNFNCGCSINAHGFVNPFTGKRVEHIRKKVAKAKAKRGTR